MADKPILFSGPMVRALLNGSKTQTRRVLKPTAEAFETPKYRRGDRLWVRERFAISGIGWGKKPSEAIGGRVHFHADPDHGWQTYWGNWHPSIHMPRWASRLTLIVTDMRVQRVQDISETDAIEEGCRPFFDEANPKICAGPNGHQHKMAPLKGPVDDFHRLWDSLNAKRGFGWDANPWVVATTFTVHRCNIDQMEVPE